MNASVRKGAKGKESRMRLLAAATYEFAHSGYHETRVSAIVARAGLTQAAFYLYFPSKEALFAELVGDFRVRMREVAAEVRLEAGIAAKDVSARLEGNLETAFRFLEQYADMARLVLCVAREREQIKEEIIVLWAGNLLAEQKAGYLRADIPAEFMAECLYSMVERAGMRWLLSGAMDATRLATYVANVILYGIFKQEAEDTLPPTSSLKEQQ